MEGSRRLGTSTQSRIGAARLLAWAFAGLILIAAMSEVALRFGLGLGNPILITRDEACGYTLKPDQDVVRFFAHTHVNHFAMRSDEVTAVRRPGTLRLMFVGDSVTYGTTQVDQKQIFAELLHRDLPGIVHRPVEVLNASAGAWAPDNELSYIRSRGIFQSDIVLLVLNDGDLTQPRATIAEVGDDLPQRRPSTAIGELYARYIRPRMAHLMGKADAGDSVAANAGEVLRANLADLDQIEAFVRSQGARSILIYIPFSKDIPAKSQASQSILQAWSAAHSVPMCDLTAAETPYAPNEITLDHGIHLNTKGHRIVAEAIERSWPQLAGRQ